MKLKYVIGLCIVLFSCEKTYHNQLRITGTWKLTLEMYDNAQLIGIMEGEIVFLADNTAKLLLNEGELVKNVNYNWYQQTDHIVLINQSSNFPLPYYVVSQTANYVELTQTDDVKMKLFR